MSHDLSLLIEIREAAEDDYLIAGATSFKIDVSGTAQIMVTKQGNKTPIRLLDMAYVPGFMTNLVPLLILIIFWDGIDSTLI